MFKKYLSLLFIIFSFQFSFAQTNSLNSQFQIMKAQSTNYQEFKVIPIGKLDGFWSLVQDSLKQGQVQITSLTKTIDRKTKSNK